MKLFLWYPLKAQGHPDLANIIEDEQLDVRDIKDDMLFVEIDTDKLKKLREDYPYLLASSQVL